MPIRRAASLPGEREVVYHDALKELVDGTTREFLDAYAERGGPVRGDKSVVRWLRHPDIALFWLDKDQPVLELWRRTAGSWGLEARAPRGLVAVRFDREARVCLPTATAAESPWAEFLVAASGADFFVGSNAEAAVSPDGRTLVQSLGRELHVVGAGGAERPPTRLGISRSAQLNPMIDATGELLITQSQGGVVRVVDLPALEGGERLCVDEVGAPLLSLHALARSTQPGDRLAAAGTDFRGPGASVAARAAVRVPGDEDLWRLSPDWVSSADGTPVEYLTSVVFVPGNEDHLLLAGPDAELCVWAYLADDDTLSAVDRQGAPGTRSRKVNDLAANPTTGQVAAASEQGLVHLLDFEPGAPWSAQERVVDVSAEFPPPRTRGLYEPQRISCVAWSPDGQGLVAGRGDGSLFWIDPEAGSLVRARPRAMGAVDHVRSVAVGRGPAGVLVATAWDHHGVGLWRWGASEPEVVLEHGDRVLAVAFGAGGSVLYTGDLSGQVRVWDLATWRDEPPVCVAKIDVEPAVLLDLDGAGADGVFLTAGQQSGLRRWDLAAFDRHVAGNLAFWSEELADEADPAVVRALHEWAEGVLARWR